MKAFGFSTGIETLDNLLEGLRGGDNVVFHTSAIEQFAPFAKALLRHCRRGVHKVIHVKVDGSLQHLVKDLPSQSVFDMAAFGHDRQTLTEEFKRYLLQTEKYTYWIFDNFTAMRSVLGGEEALKKFFLEICPLLYELETIAYWPLLKDQHPAEIVAAVRDCTQVFLDLSTKDSNVFIKPIKVWGRYSETMFIPHRVISEDDSLCISPVSGEELDLASYAAELLDKGAELSALKDRLNEANVELMRRNRELSALNAIAETLSRSLDLETTLHDTLQKVLKVMEIEAGLIHLLDEEARELIVRAHQGLSSQYVQGVDRLKLGEGLAGRVAQSGEPLVVDDISSDPRLTRMVVQEERKRSFVSVPLKARDRVLGTMNLVSQSFRRFSPQDLQLLIAIGHQIGVAVENAQLYEEIREYAQTLEQRVEERTREIQDRTHALAVAEERNRLARELHDSVTQYLFSIVLNANATGTLLGKDQQQAREQIQVVQEIAQNALGEMRSLIFELRPAMLEEKGLPYVLALYIDSIKRKEGLDVVLRVDGERRLPGDLEQGLYRIAQEALFNVVKHAMAKTVIVDLEIRPNHVSLSVEDDGVGFDPSSPPGKGITLGLSSMKERAKLLGGDFEIQSQPGQGTRVSVHIPLEE